VLFANDEYSIVLTGTTSVMVIVVREPTSRFVQLGGTNIVNSTIQQNAGEKRNAGKSDRCT
jgi:hypothetical protein